MDIITDELNNLISTEITPDQWDAVPGGLDKVSSSSLGFAWGMGSDQVWICQLPCAGDWKPVTIPESTKIYDVTADESRVYVLYDGGGMKLASKSANNSDDWIVVSAKDGMTKVTTTGSYVWGQAGSQKWRIHKPVTMSNWVQVADPRGITITSASSSSLYGVDDKGNAVKTDEAMQSGWSTIPEFGGKYNSVLGDADERALYGVNQANQVQRCLNGDCSNLSTQGFVPQSLTVEPVSNQLWMTTTTPGNSGNIFSKHGTTDYSAVFKLTQPYEKERDNIVQQLEVDHSQTTGATAISKQLELIKKFFEELFGYVSKDINDDAKSKINDVVSETEKLIRASSLIKKILILLSATAVVYLVGGILGGLTHLVALAVFAGGLLYLSLNNGV
jgi:hypothetical protein